MKTAITNRLGLRLVIEVEEIAMAQSLAFVAHGLGGSMNTHVPQTLASAFRDAGYTVVLWDATNSGGESEGIYEDATITTFFSDMQDVIAWASEQAWYREPFVVCGHSFGGICSLLYALKRPTKVKAIALISSVISGELSLQTPKFPPELIAEWKRTGWHERPSTAFAGLTRRAPWSQMEDRLRYDVLPDAHKIIVPTLIVVGEKDDGTPSQHQQLLFDRLGGEKEMHIIEAAGHNYDGQEQLDELRGVVTTWAKSL